MSVAVRDNAGALTWADLDQRVDRTARALTASGVAPGDCVAILGPNSAAYLQVMFGCLRAGGCITPLPGLASEDSLLRMLADCRARFLFVHHQSDLAIAQAAQALPGSADLTVVTLKPSGGALLDLESFIAEREGLAGGASPRPEPGWPFNLIYSSGTTGAPKGIIQDRGFRAQEAQDMAAAFNLGGDTRTLVSTPLYSNTTLFLLISTLAAGGCVELMEKFNSAEFLRRAEVGEITEAVLVPVQYARVLADPDFNVTDLSAFRTKFCTSAPLPAATKREILARWPAGGVVEFYGMTEGGVNCTLFCHERPDKLDTVGQPAPDCDLRIVDESGCELGVGQVGEVVGRGPKMMAGYHNRSDATREASWWDAEGRRFHRSGDLGWLDNEGFLHLLDRKKDLIISGGLNIYAADLEAVLSDHPGVLEAAVIPAPSATWGETPVAYVTLRTGVELEVEGLRAWANARLGKAQRLAEVRLCAGLPRNAVGKVLKRELRERYAAETSVAA
jgi:long-chain acyl-CoA synthetase